MEECVGKLISLNDPNFHVVELPGNELLISSKAGFQTISIVGYSESLAVRLARVAGHRRGKDDP